MILQSLTMVLKYLLVLKELLLLFLLIQWMLMLLQGILQLHLKVRLLVESTLIPTITTNASIVNLVVPNAKMAILALNAWIHSG